MRAPSRRGTTRPMSWWSGSGAPAPARPSRRPRPAPRCWCSRPRRWVAAPRRCRAGSSTSAAARPIQEACGYTDTAEDMERFLLAACGPDADAAKVHAVLPGQRRPLPLARRPRRPVRGRASTPSRAGSRPTTPAWCSAAARTRGRSPTSRPRCRAGHHPKFPDAAGGFLMQRLHRRRRRDGGAGRRPTPSVERLVVDDGAVVGVEATDRRCHAARSGPAAAWC